MLVFADWGLVVAARTVNLVCASHRTLPSWLPLELHGDGRAQPGVGGLGGLRHLHHQRPQHVVQQAAHGSPSCRHWPGGAEWKEAQVPGPDGVGQGEAWPPPRGVEGKGSWASWAWPGKKCLGGESTEDMGGLVLLGGKEKGASRDDRSSMGTIGAWPYSQDFLDQPVLLAETGKGWHPPSQCW